jgi:Ca2+-transporting ATPase
MIPEPAPDAFARPVADVAARLGVDPAAGLSASEAEHRAGAGANVLAERERPSVLRMVLESATEPFVVMLFVAGLLAILLGEVRDGLLILIGLVPIVGADVVTEFRAERALQALRDASAPTAHVRRDATASTVPAATLVPGDVVLLAAGDVAPADLRVARSDGLLVDASALTGESVPELRRADPDPPDAPLADRRSVVHSGTSIVGGRGEGIVVAIGEATEIGRIAGGLTGQVSRRSPLQRELDRLVRIMLVVAIGLIVVVGGLGFLRGRTLGENVLAAISAAIAAIPEEPPVLLAVILGLGAYRLLRRGVLVRRLNAEEALGAVDLIVTDKTGTITQNRLVLRSIRQPSERGGGEATSETLRDALAAEEDAWAAARGARLGAFSRAIADALDDADGTEGDRAALDPWDLVEAMAAGDGRPVGLTRAREDGRIVGRALGAPEVVFDLAGVEGTERRRWQATVEDGIADGERLLALAFRPDDSAPWSIRAVLGFADPPREGVDAALARARGAGIDVVVVTGDHPGTAAAIARRAGLLAERVATGSELATWDDEQLARELDDLHVVARSTPTDKERIVRVARAAGRMVVVTGDGVNDAPALHAADVAVAMGSGTAVARESADLVLGDDSFATLMDGLIEGRRIVDNVRKGLVFLLSTHVALLGFVLVATVVGFDQPLLPIQILWLELFIDLSTSVAFEREPPEPDLETRPPRPVGRPLLSRTTLGRIALAGSFSVLGALVLMTLVAADSGFDHGRWVAFSALVCGQAVRAYANRSTSEPVTDLDPNRLLLAGVVATIGIQVAIPYVPLLAEAFRASPLAAPEWLLVTVVALAPAVLADVFRRFGHREWIA